MKIYVASSWKNSYLDQVVRALREDGHDVYDFREHGFSWDEALSQANVVSLKQRDGLVPELRLSAKEWERATMAPVARAGFRQDYDALRRADAVVLVLPAGRSAHLEAGYACGVTVVHVLQLELERPDLMSRMIDFNGGRVWSELDELRFELLPGNREEKATERAARLVERSSLGPEEKLKNLAAQIRARRRL